MAKGRKNGIKPGRHVKPEQPPPPSVDGDLDSKESSAFSDDVLEKDAKRGHHRRQESILNHFHKGMVIAFYVILFIALAALSAYFYHLVTPRQIHFLSPSQIDKLKDTVFTGFTGAVLGFLSSYLRQRIKPS